MKVDLDLPVFSSTSCRGATFFQRTSQISRPKSSTVLGHKRWGLLVQEFKGSDGNDRFEKYTVVKVTMKPCFEVDCYSASGSTSPKKSQA